MPIPFKLRQTVATLSKALDLRDQGDQQAFEDSITSIDTISRFRTAEQNVAESKARTAGLAQGTRIAGENAPLVRRGLEVDIEAGETGIQTAKDANTRAQELFDSGETERALRTQLSSNAFEVAKLLSDPDNLMNEAQVAALGNYLSLLQQFREIETVTSQLPKAGEVARVTQERDITVAGAESAAAKFQRSLTEAQDTPAFRQILLDQAENKAVLDIATAKAAVNELELRQMTREELQENSTIAAEVLMNNLDFDEARIANVLAETNKLKSPSAFQERVNFVVDNPMSLPLEKENGAMTDLGKSLIMGLFGVSTAGRTSLRDSLFMALASEANRILNDPDATQEEKAAVIDRLNAAQNAILRIKPAPPPEGVSIPEATFVIDDLLRGLGFNPDKNKFEGKNATITNDQTARDFLENTISAARQRVPGTTREAVLSQLQTERTGFQKLLEVAPQAVTEFFGELTSEREQRLRERLTGSDEVVDTSQPSDAEAAGVHKRFMRVNPDGTIEESDDGGEGFIDTRQIGKVSPTFSRGTEPGSGMLAFVISKIVDTTFDATKATAKAISQFITDHKEEAKQAQQIIDEIERRQGQ